MKHWWCSRTWMISKRCCCCCCCRQILLLLLLSSSNLIVVVVVVKSYCCCCCCCCCFQNLFAIPIFVQWIFQVNLWFGGVKGTAQGLSPQEVLKKDMFKECNHRSSQGMTGRLGFFFHFPTFMTVLTLSMWSFNTSRFFPVNLYM